MTKWIGLTGGIATGKTTVAEFIKNFGHPVINADEVAHLALRPESPVFKTIVQHFGPSVLDAAGNMDRRRLGAVIFKNESERLFLESMIHPFVKNKVAELRSQFEKQGQRIIFYDVPLLFEKNMQSEFDKTIVVSCSSEQQLQRLIKRNGLSPIEARERISSQLPMAEKIKRADFVIDNSGSIEDLKQQTAKVISTL